MQIIAPSGHIQGLKTPALQGQMDARAGLKILLRGTRLTVASDNGRVITLRRLVDAPPARTMAAPYTPAAVALIQASSPELREVSANAPVLEDIVVTAQRRQENVQKVPIAVTVVTQETLQKNNVQSVGDIQYMVPSLSSGTRTSRESISLNIRGQGQSITGQPGVIVYVNEVPLMWNYQGETMGGPGLLFDLEQVEVLKGPQGTLFGRNSVGGALLLRTAKPAKEFGGSVQLGYGNYNNREVNAAINVPIIADTLLARVAFNAQQRDGFTHVLAEPSSPSGIDADDRDYFAVRGSLTFRPDGRFQNDIVASYSEYDNQGSPNFLVAAGGAAVGLFPGITALVAQQAALGARTILPLDTDLKSRGSLFTVSNTTTLELNESVTLRNIVGYSIGVQAFGRDADGTAFPVLSTPFLPVDRTYRQFSIEPQVQIKALDGRLNWVIGAFYLNQPLPKNYTATTTRIFGSRADDAIRISQKSQALFTQASYEVVDNLTLTAGLRQTWDERFRSRLGGSFGSVCEGITVNCSTPVDTQSKSNALTWTLGMAYQADPNTMFYVTSRRGYRTGGANDIPTQPTFAPEFVTDFEGGVKSRWYVGSVPIRTNGALYYQNYTDIQVPQNVFSGGVFTFLTTNSGQARLWGAEFEATAQVSNNLEIGAHFDHLDFKATKVGEGVNRTQLDGSRLADRPAWKYGVTAKYRVPLAGESEVSVQGQWNWQSRTNTNYTDTLNAPTNDIRPYGLLNLSAAWDRVGGSAFDLSVYASNVLDKTYTVSGATLLSSVGVSFLQYGEPRMFGVRARYHFGVH